MFELAVTKKYQLKNHCTVGSLLCLLVCRQNLSWKKCGCYQQNCLHASSMPAEQFWFYWIFRLTLDLPVRFHSNAGQGEHEGDISHSKHRHFVTHDLPAGQVVEKKLRSRQFFYDSADTALVGLQLTHVPTASKQMKNPSIRVQASTDWHAPTNACLFRLAISLGGEKLMRGMACWQNHLGLEHRFGRLMHARLHPDFHREILAHYELTWAMLGRGSWKQVKGVRTHML
jgi:hypothetical protein